MWHRRLAARLSLPQGRASAHRAVRAPLGCRGTAAATGLSSCARLAAPALGASTRRAAGAAAAILLAAGTSAAVSVAEAENESTTAGLGPRQTPPKTSTGLTQEKCWSWEVFDADGRPTEAIVEEVVSWLRYKRKTNDTKLEQEWVQTVTKGAGHDLKGKRMLVIVNPEAGLKKKKHAEVRFESLCVVCEGYGLRLGSVASAPRARAGCVRAYGEADAACAGRNPGAAYQRRRGEHACK